MAEPKDKVMFSREQAQYLRELFPHRVLPPAATDTELRTYFGQQSVLAVIESRVR